MIGENLIVVSDWSSHVVKMFTMNGEYQSTIGSTRGDRDGQFNNPFGLAFKILFVVDCGNYRVQAFDTTKNNAVRVKFGFKGSGPAMRLTVQLTAEISCMLPTTTITVLTCFQMIMAFFAK